MRMDNILIYSAATNGRLHPRFGSFLYRCLAGHPCRAMTTVRSGGVVRNSHAAQKSCRPRPIDLRDPASDNMPLSVDPKPRQSGGHFHDVEATCRENMRFRLVHRGATTILNYRHPTAWLICH
jgi:hypothetical protein